MVKNHERRDSHSEVPNRNDPGRFFGDGVVFKAKLIGILEVGEARGDRMCQEALQDLKMAIRAAGEHKQRITIHVTLDGLRLRDEKTGDSLYHHPVHKISFIAQDMTDSRAFGYIFGSPDSGHRFFGIKTDKAASQVVLAMRDLFQVVFELKKKEIEMARQQIQSKTIHEHQPIALTVKNATAEPSPLSYNKSLNESSSSKSNAKEMSPESVADLVDLEQELSSLQRGITQMERITPNEPPTTAKSLSEEDPFGDSFTSFPTYNLLPPPESSRSRHSKPVKPPDTTTATTTTTLPDVSIPSFTASQTPSSAAACVATTSSGSMTAAPIANSSNLTRTSDNWLEHGESIPFDSQTPKSHGVDGQTNVSSSATSTTRTTATPPTTGGGTATGPGTTSGSHLVEDIQLGEDINAFTDLDPLGTGKSKPYIDKKYFFQELKNPPKKVLKDLSGQDGASFQATFSGGGGVDSIDKTDIFADKRSTSDSYDVVHHHQPPPSLTSHSTAPHGSGPGSAGLTSMTSSSVASNRLPDTKPLDFISPKVFPQTNLERGKLEEPVMIPRDTDPFSPTRKKSDPFQEGDIFSKLDPFEFDFGNRPVHTEILPDTKITNDECTKIKRDANVFNGPLQVSLPPESWTSTMAQKKIERQSSESPTSASRNRPSVFKQNTVDVISSISSKKMPHLFGQKFSKRDSNSINMRRLQESDSLSENETAPEPPPRPESASHIEPPPLPPKKQFSDIVIRPRITSSSAIPPPMRYDYVTSRIKSTQSLDSAPPIPLPSRKIGRTDSSYPGPGRPGRKPGGEEEDYLTPITTSRGDVPPLLPPPQTKSRGRRLEHVEHNKTEIETPAIPPPLASRVQPPTETIIPDITLSQLLTLGIDDLAVKLNVPTSKLNTMTLVELTTYLSEFIENSKKSPKPPPKRFAVAESAVFKVNFDQNSDATFVAKFDDNFGEEPVAAPFVANFSNFDAMPEQPTSVPSSIASVVPSADRYAVFREIMEQDGAELSSSLEKEEDSEMDVDKDGEEESPEPSVAPAPIQVVKIDTKITDVISQAKDRYAALRDIILVEDLFEKSATRPTESFSNSDLMEEAEREEENDVFHDIENEKSANEESSPENNQRFRDSLETTTEIRQTPEIRQNGTLLNKDDFEIDELMNRAISNLSLNSRENLSPTVAGTAKSPAMAAAQNASTSPIDMQQSKSPNNITSQLNQIAPMKSQFNDMSTSPIPQQKSPAQKSPMNIKSPLTKSPLSKSPLPQSPAVTSLIDASKRANSGSLSDVVCGSSPEADAGTSVPDQQKSILTPSAATTESWAIFDQPVIEKKILKSPKGPVKELAADSPCSSDGKDDWNKGEPDYNKRWPKGQTSSSSRDLSPWDDDAPDYKKRPGPPGADRHGYYMRHARRMNSCDDDYEYEEEISKRRERRGKSSLNRSRENFDSDSQNWYHPSNHHNWSPPEDDSGRPRTFDRGAYERSTYGPPYDKRDHKGSCIPYDARRNYKNYEKRKYYREYSRPDYDFESYGESPDVKDRKLNYYGDSFEKPKVRRDYENIYEDEFSRESRSAGHKSRGEYYYDRDRKSFDRESVESYESTGRRHKSFGSGDVYGSLDSREEFRERYMGAEKTRSLRKGIKMRGTEEYEQDSENDVQVRRPPGDTRSLQRPPQCTRIRKSSGSSPWDGEEIPPPPSAGQKGWKRPSSASESERRLAENLRVFSHTLSGSDGEKDRRFRKKPRSRGGKDIDGRQQPFGTVRYAPHRGDPNYDYIGYEDYEQPMDEDKFERLNRRRQDMHQRMMESERRKKGDKFGFDDDDEAHPKQQQQQHTSKKDSFYSPSEKERCYAAHKFDAFDEPPKSGKSLRKEFDFDDFEETPRSNTSSGKFNFEEHGGFESDFNSPPPTNPGPPPSTVSATKSSFRFSNDFSDKEKSTTVYDSEVYNQTPTQKLRFDEKVTVSKFESDSHGAFEDDFSKTEFLFENEDQWTNELPKKNSLRLSKRQENIKKSESVNIFAKKSEDPFEDDDFFNSTTSPGGKDELTSSSGTSKRNSGNGNTSTGGGGNGSGVADSNFQWDNNFAKFDENM